ncbi:MAG: tRNA 4-thiouridine(8) synthase ThiI [Lentisphaerae bacterium GWF2_45_14]|nr:MAG: tRNA 4-thiouridine(8) synthase ThiI [Lentisphaerae bacterium GWF2_45_14]
MFNAVICRYNEIAIKGGNRNMFESRMIENIYMLLKELPSIKVSRERGRIWIKHEKGGDFSCEELELIKENLQRAFGLSSFSPVIMCRSELSEIEKAVEKSSPEYFRKVLDANGKASFRVRARRSFKSFPFESKELEIKLAEAASRSFDVKKLAVNLHKADITIGCEVREKFSFIFYEEFQGPGGLPTGSSSPVLILLSGGIDSPVASYMMMKRGCRVNFITFHSDPYTPPETVEKVKKLVELINTYQRPGKLFICNLAPIQKMIRDNCDEKYRTVLYRRMMFRIAAKVARYNRLEALVTGESVGQVASQTIINLGVIDNASPMLVLRPLAGIDKIDTIKISEKMGAFEISKIQVPDSCTVFAPSSPVTSARLRRVIDEEEKLDDFETVLNEIRKNIEVFSRN